MEAADHGHGRPAVLADLDDLLAMPLVEEQVTLSCVSNEVGGDLVGNARGGRAAARPARTGRREPAATRSSGRSVDELHRRLPDRAGARRRRRPAGGGRDERRAAAARARVSGPPGRPRASTATCRRPSGSPRSSSPSGTTSTPTGSHGAGRGGPDQDPGPYRRAAPGASVDGRRSRSPAWPGRRPAASRGRGTASMAGDWSPAEPAAGGQRRVGAVAGRTVGGAGHATTPAKVRATDGTARPRPRRSGRCSPTAPPVGTGSSLNNALTASLTRNRMLPR